MLIAAIGIVAGRIKISEIILAQADSVTNRFAEAHVMEVPPRPPAPHTRQRVCRRAKRRTQEIVLIVPIAEPASEEHCENSLRVVRCEVPGCAKADYRGLRSRPAAVGPEMPLRAKCCKPIGSRDIRRAEKWREVDVSSCSER